MTTQPPPSPDAGDYAGLFGRHEPQNFTGPDAARIEALFAHGDPPPPGGGDDPADGRAVTR